MWKLTHTTVGSLGRGQCLVRARAETGIRVSGLSPSTLPPTTLRYPGLVYFGVGWGYRAFFSLGMNSHVHLATSWQKRPECYFQGRIPATNGIELAGSQTVIPRSAHTVWRDEVICVLGLSSVGLMFLVWFIHRQSLSKIQYLEQSLANNSPQI